MPSGRIDIRKYPNRRYYNSRDSRHVTLEEIRDLVRDGHDIKVVDSRTEEDITVAVLTQILLEIESPKLAFFPTNFLQHLIRQNTDVFKSMTESYFKHTLASFVKSAESAQTGQIPGAATSFPASLEDWQRMWLGMVPAMPENARGSAKSAATKSPDADARVAELSRQVEELRASLQQLKKRRQK